MTPVRCLARAGAHPGSIPGACIPASGGGGVEPRMTPRLNADSEQNAEQEVS